MQTLLIILVIFLGAGLILSVLAMSQMVRRMKETVQALEKTVNQLASQVELQERRLDELQSLQAKPAPDTLLQLVGAFSNVRNKGWLGVATMLGSQLFQSYFRYRRAKALPSKTIEVKK